MNVYELSSGLETLGIYSSFIKAVENAQLVIEHVSFHRIDFVIPCWETEGEMLRIYEYEIDARPTHLLSDWVEIYPDKESFAIRDAARDLTHYHVPIQPSKISDFVLKLEVDGFKRNYDDTYDGCIHLDRYHLKQF